MGSKKNCAGDFDASCDAGTGPSSDEGLNKLSYYNVLVRLDEDGLHEGGACAHFCEDGGRAQPGDAWILYNTRTMALGTLDASEKALYDELCSGDAPGVDARALADDLERAGFCMKSAEVEAEFMRYQFEKYRYDDRVFELYVAPTMDCNFSCPYCFERKRPGRMSPKTQDALLSFVEEQYVHRPFRELKIVWYGGEPLLCVDIIESLSARFMRFCEGKGVEYVASMVSNASLANERVQNVLEACHVWSVMATVDGSERSHEERRPSCAGCGSYQTILDNVDGMSERGICVDFRCILDKGNVSDCLDLTAKMAHRDNVGVRVKAMRDVGEGYGSPGEAIPFPTLSPEEYARAFYEVFMQSDPDEEAYRRLLTPLHLHCSAALDRGYAIDELGNAFNCGCAIGDEAKILFNINEAPEERTVRWDLVSWYASKNPLDIQRCRTCAVLPLCQGGCLRIDEPPFSECSPLRYLMKRLVEGYYRASNT